MKRSLKMTLLNSYGLSKFRFIEETGKFIDLPFVRKTLPIEDFMEEVDLVELEKTENENVEMSMLIAFFDSFCF